MDFVFHGVPYVHKLCSFSSKNDRPRQRFTYPDAPKQYVLEETVKKDKNRGTHDAAYAAISKPGSVKATPMQSTPPEQQ